MISFFVSLAILICGYFFYGSFVEKLFGPDDRQTCANTKNDSVDFVPMKTWKVFMIQLLNIAGLGPIFGAISGALWGPQVFLWICFGSVFAGGVHDYLSGMLSERHGGASISEITGIYLGKGMLQVMRVFSVILLVFVGVAFLVGPAQLLARLTPDSMTIKFWVLIILAYYFLATMFPIDKIIGKLYPFFGAVLIFMAFGIIIGLFANGYRIPEISFSNQHPSGTAIFPFMFITVACGAISGFHSTQSPMMARCITSEREGRKVFYGAMIAEGIIALIWAAAGCAYYEGGTTIGLANALKAFGGSPANVVYDVSFGLLGKIGGVLAILGVIACPITSGDTAFRSARLTIADWINIDQSKTKKRLAISVPLLAVGFLISKLNYTIIWRYFSWSNQTLAMIVLWAASVYMFRFVKNKYACLITAIPATFMAAVSATYICLAPEGFKMSANIGYPIGFIFALGCLVIFIFTTVMHPEKKK
ncbi:MAG: carbon starvation protein A [Synergistaceae bacterium]|nr:carbon starvation protein A [Synergistaceae bacterium]